MLEKIHYQRQPWCKESIIKESIFISSREVNDYRRQQPALNYEYPIKYLMIQVMRKYYIIVNLHAHVKSVWCKIWCFYLKETSTTFSCCQHLIKARWHSFVAYLNIQHMTQKTLRMILIMKCVTLKQRYHCWLKRMILQWLKQVMSILTTYLNYHVSLTLSVKLRRTVTIIPLPATTKPWALLGNLQRKCFSFRW